MQSGARAGADAAHAIRMRYFQKEFEQIQSLEVQPELDRLQAANAAMVAATKASVMPVPIIRSPEEIQQRQEAMGQGTTNITTIPGAPGGPDGKPGAPQVIEQPIAAPNLSMQGDTLGAVETKEQLAFINPETGTPIPIDSAAGIAHMQASHSAFGEVNASVQQSLMDIMARYAGNPFAAQYADSLMENLSKQSNLMTAGTSDPAKAQEWLEGRQKFDSDMETAELKQQEAQAENERAQGNRNALVQQARDSVMRGRAPSGLGEKLVEKIRNGGDLTAQEEATVAAAQKMSQEAISKRAAAALKSGTGIKPGNVSRGEFWQGDLMTGDSPVAKEYKQNYTHSMDDSADQEVKAFRLKGEAELLEYFKANGIPVDEQDNYTGQGEISDDGALMASLTADAAAKGSRAKANGIAMVQILEKLEWEHSQAGDDEVTATVDRSLNEMESEIRRANENSPRPRSARSVQYEVDYWRRNRAHAFVRHNYGKAGTPEADEPLQIPTEYRDRPLGTEPLGAMAPEPEVEVPLGADATENELLARRLGLPAAPSIAPRPRISHGDTGSARLVDRAMVGFGPASVSDLNMIAAGTSKSKEEQEQVDSREFHLAELVRSVSGPTPKAHWRDRDRGR